MSILQRIVLQANPGEEQPNPQRSTSGEEWENPLQSNRPVNSYTLPNALALTNRRSRYRSSVSTANHRRSAPRAFGQSSAANPFTVPRKILCASATDSTANATLPARRSSPQVTPSLVAEYQTVPPRKSSPQTTQCPSSGIQPINRLIHNAKYVTGIHTLPTCISSSTASINRNTASSGAPSGSASSTTS